ncbi:tyrosine-type recombinase/integrase [Rhodococcus qingshengii]|uniref:tyrosine-type recombinase/integrase n=1 Tax=Rhodococcus qingshengii TaxID=334542 RepID=UPI0024BA1750|nr:site-specific integrase [Rhodococcus qingshengii]MDJ0440885.1 site-specific integrase [Rhodococcus qingshengii]
MTVGLCTYHHHKWRAAVKRKPKTLLEDWLADGEVAIPVRGKLPGCRVPACPRDARTRTSMLCELHQGRYRRSSDPSPVEEWVLTQPPYLADHQFTLIHVDELLRWEVLYALQQRDARGGRMEPYAMRLVISQMQSTASLSTMTDGEVWSFTDLKRESDTNAHLVEFARYLRNGHDQMNGRGPKDRLVWDLIDIGIKRDPTLLGGTRRRRGLDFTPITQPWLRELTLAWARKQTQARLLTETVRVTIAVSRTLDQRRDHGNHLARLSDQDVAAITDEMNRLAALKGDSVSAKHKRRLYARFFRLIEWGRRSGQLDELPPSFARLPLQSIPFESFTDEQPGKAIPVHIQRQLDANIDSIGRGLNYGELTDEQAHWMFRTAYVVLRDTGRRPLEVATLAVDCLTREDSGPILKWNNHKAKRYGRRLPILQTTADAIRQWIDMRSQINAPARSDSYLFPSVAERAGEPYIRSYSFSRCIRLWVDGLESLDTTDVDDNGDPLPFDRMLVYPYAFRHSYAQRHADNGTPIDVLRDLMDHKSMQTTSGYYKITADRKRTAVRTVGKYIIDRHGTRDPLTDPTAYQMRSVAVPFGNCIEPSNVKAGGHSCPVRFQCAGCGFYRPDPSFIPAIEEHLNTLRSDREIARAMDTASYVVDNLTAQIESFDAVLHTMHDRLDALDSAERDRVEQASIALRRARAGIPLPLIVRERGTQE